MVLKLLESEPVWEDGWLFCAPETGGMEGSYCYWNEGYWGLDVCCGLMAFFWLVRFTKA